jgi:DNA-binding MarR family transcriptional regulator
MGSDDKPILERIEQVLAELSRSIGANEREDDPEQVGVRDGQAPKGPLIDPAISGEVANRLTAALAWIKARSARDHALGDELFFDPAWSILLELYIHYCQRTAVSITSLCISAKVPSSTGLRWVALLERRGLVVREPDPFDRRKVYATLTPDAVEKLEAALDASVAINRQLSGNGI